MYSELITFNKLFVMVHSICKCNMFWECIITSLLFIKSVLYNLYSIYICLLPTPRTTVQQVELVRKDAKRLRDNVFVNKNYARDKFIYHNYNMKKDELRLAPKGAYIFNPLNNSLYIKDKIGFHFVIY